MSPDAVIIGGGPAGSAIGRLLASWGHSVLILATSADRSRGLAESLPPSTQKLLAEVGVLDAVERAGFYRATGNTAWWASRDRRVERFNSSASGPVLSGSLLVRQAQHERRVEGLGTSVVEASALGYQVYRPDFDRVLLDSAANAGARVRVGARARSVRFDADRSARVDYEHHGRRSAVSCRFVLDCSGRAGVVGRRFRRAEPGHRMYALVGVWQKAGHWDLPDETHTVVETCDSGWAWSVPISASTRHVGMMVDGITPHGANRRALADAYRVEIGQTAHVRALVDDALLQDVWACDASLYSSDVYAGPQFLLIGDAGSFIDPLSSFGVKKALASAWLGAVVVHTCLTHADRQDVALGFFSQREREIYAAHLRRSSDFARAAQVEHPHPFWVSRASIDPVGVPENDDANDAQVREAFERIKQAPSIEFRLADDARLNKAPIIRGREIVLEDALAVAAAGLNGGATTTSMLNGSHTTGSAPGVRPAIRFFENVDLVKLAEMACQHTRVPDLFEAYCRSHAPVPLPSLLTALSLLVAKRILKPIGA